MSRLFEFGKEEWPMKIKSIEIEFENCDSVKIHGNYISNIELSGIKTRYQMHGDNDLSKVNDCDFFALGLHGLSNCTYKEFGQEDCVANIYDRLSDHDITWVFIETDNVEPDKRILDFYVNWKPCSEYQNPYQSAIRDDNGNFGLVINDQLTASDIFCFKR